MGPRNSSGAVEVHGAQFSPDGQLLAIGLPDGVDLYQAKSGKHIGLLPSGPCESVLFDNEGKAVISGGPWGYYRWPIRRRDGTRRRRNRGARSTLDRSPGAAHRSEPEWGDVRAQWLPDHKTLAVIDNPAAGVRLIDTSQPHPARKPYDCLFSAEPPPDHDRDQPRRQVGRLRRVEGVGHHALGPPSPPAGPDPQRERRTGQQHLLRRLQPRWKKDGFKLNDCCDRLFCLGSWHMEECSRCFPSKASGPTAPPYSLPTARSSA